MREIQCRDITRAVAEMSVESCCRIRADIEKALREAAAAEESETAREVLRTLLENAAIAGAESIPICQDTGMALVFAEVGQDVRVVGGDLGAAINAGVARGYSEGYLRKSVVSDPIRRENTGDNTPAVVYYDIVPGDRLGLTVAPKGFGSENMSALSMLKPSQGLQGVLDFVAGTVERAGPNPCPPVIVGVGVGGTMDRAALMAKKALLLPVDGNNPDPFWAGVEADLLSRINALGIGPAGFGGRTTALAVRLLAGATHIAGLPVAVNIGCHVTRHAERIL